MPPAHLPIANRLAAALVDQTRRALTELILNHRPATALLGQMRTFSTSLKASAKRRRTSRQPAPRKRIMPT